MSDFHKSFAAKTEQELEEFGLTNEAIRQLDPGMEWVRLVHQRRLEQAYVQLRQAGPLPEMTSHIRADPAEPDNLPLRKLQYMIAWTARDLGLTGVRVPDDPTGRRIAVVGGGPAGLAATVRLLEKGHAVDLYEREDRLGGAPALVYQEERLPDPADEIDALLQPALHAKRLSIHLGHETSSEALLTSHDAVLLATGCWNEPSLGTADGVWSALDFLKAVRCGECITVPGHVVLLCGGDAAMDAAAVARSLGPKQLTLLFDCPRDETHWHLPDTWFDLPGVSARFDVRATGYQLTPTGSVTAVLLKANEPLETTMVIEALSLYPDTINPQDSLFTAGALVNGGASVQQCIHEALTVADDIDRHLQQT